MKGTAPIESIPAGSFRGDEWFRFAGRCGLAGFPCRDRFGLPACRSCSGFRSSRACAMAARGRSGIPVTVKTGTFWRISRSIAFR
jgi:hypothetical protein